MSQLTQFIDDLESVKTLYDACWRVSQRKNKQIKEEINKFSKVSKELLEQIDEELKQLANVETETEDVEEPLEAEYSHPSNIKKALMNFRALYEPAVKLELGQSES